MSKNRKLQTAVQNTLNVLPASIRDAGQMAARAVDNLTRVATWCKANMANFPDVSKEDRAAFRDGALIHYQTVKAPVYYLREGKNLIRLDSAPDKMTPEHVKIDVAYATGMTGQAHGGLKTVDPALYEAVTPYRTDCNKYAANKWIAVCKAAKALDPVERQRGATDPFKVRVEKIFDTLAKSAKTARENRGDVTAPTPEQFKAAVKAFWTALSS